MIHGAMWNILFDEYLLSLWTTFAWDRTEEDYNRLKNYITCEMHISLINRIRRGERL